MSDTPVRDLLARWDGSDMLPGWGTYKEADAARTRDRSAMMAEADGLDAKLRQADADRELGRLVRTALANGDKRFPALCVEVIGAGIRGSTDDWLAGVETEFRGRYPQGEGTTYIEALLDLVAKLEANTDAEAE